MSQPRAYVQENIVPGWRVRTPAGDFIVLRRSDFVTAEKLELYPHNLRFDIAAPQRDPLLWRSLLGMYESVYGRPSAAPLRTRLPWLLDRIHEAFRRGDLIPVPSDWHISRRAAGSGSEQAEVQERAEPEPVAKPVEQTWFRARLRDEDGVSMAHEDYILVDSTGARTEGKLDSNGEVYIPPTLPYGDCTISFPNIHLNPRKKK